MIIETILYFLSRPILTFAPTPLGLIFAGIAVLGYASKKPRLRLASLVTLLIYLIV